MKKISLIIFILISFQNKAIAKDYIYGKAAFVPDGDTIVLKTREVVRYIGIDSPEINHGKGKPQKFSIKAKQFNSDSVFNKRLKIVFGSKKRDRFNRILAYVYLPDGEMVNKIMLKKGFAWLYFHGDNHKFNKEFLDIQKKAINDGTGIWHDIKNISKPVFINKRSKRFHAYNCKNYNKNSTKIVKAFLKGYSPSRKCIKDIFSYGSY